MVSRYWNNVQDTSPSSLSKVLDATKAWFEERRNLTYWSCQSYLLFLNHSTSDDGVLLKSGIGVTYSVNLCMGLFSFSSMWKCK